MHAAWNPIFEIVEGKRHRLLGSDTFDAGAECAGEVDAGNLTAGGMLSETSVKEPTLCGGEELWSWCEE